MDVLIKLNGTDITTSVISYSRQHQICSGIGTLDLVVEAKTARDIDPWDEFIVEEGGDQVAIYNVSSIERTAPDGTYTVVAQDNSKRLTDYFIKDKYEITYPSSAKYWIELFLDEVGVSYTFDVTGNGAPLAENTQIGLKSAYDEIMGLLQLSGWYMYFDSSGTCRIGKVDLTAGGSPDYVFDDSDIIKTGYNKNDKYLRNRAVVWGTGDFETGQWIFADTSTITAWNRDDGDYRTVVYANPHIKTTVAAFTLAWQILNEFSAIIYTKELELHGTHGIQLGERIRLESNYIEYEGMVTTLVVNMNSEGLITTCTLDERCPRLFGFVHWTGYVYVGTYAHGVYRRLLKSTAWENYSTGLTDLSIVDLSAYDGLLGAVSATGIFFARHTQAASWAPYTPTTMLDVSTGSGLQVASGIRAVACSIEHSGLTGSYAVAFTAPAASGIAASGIDDPGIGEMVQVSGNLSWVTGLTANRGLLYNHQIYIGSGESKDYDITVLDIEALSTGSNVVTVKKVVDQYLTDIIEGDDGYYGYCRAGFTAQDTGFVGSDPTAYTSLPPVTSGVWLETAPWESLYEGWAWWGPSYTIQGNPVVSNLVTASGGYVFDSYQYISPSGLIKRETNTKALAWDPIYEEWYFDYQTDLFYISNPFNPVAGDNVDYFCKIDDENYSFIKDFGFLSGDMIYKKININSPTSFTTVTIPKDSGGQFYYRHLGSTQKVNSRARGGGNYFVAVDIDPSTMELRLIRVDMRDGSYDYTSLHSAESTNPPPDTGDYIDVTEIKESANYIYFGFIWMGISTKDGTVSAFNTVDIDYDLGAVLVDKINGTIYINTETVETFQVPAEGTEVIGSHLQESLFYAGGNSYYGYTGFRLPDFYIVAENPDTGAGWGGFYSAIQWYWSIDTNDDDFEDYLSDHVLTAYHYIGIPDGAWTEVNMGDNMVEDAPSWYLSEAKPWMHRPSGVLIGANNIMSAPSRLGYPPTLWDRYTTTKAGNAISAMVDYLDRESYEEAELITTGVGYDSAIATCAPKVDDTENIIYATVVSKHPSSSSRYYYVVGYDHNGNIVKKVQPDGRDATDSQGYFFTKTSFTTWSNTEFTVVFDMIVKHESRIRGSTVLNDQSFDFYSIYPYVSGLYSRIDRCYVIRHDTAPPSGNFTTTYVHSDPLYVDAAKGSPTAIYEYPASGAVISGGVQYGGNSHLLGVSWINEWESFEVDHLPRMPIYSVRGFDVTDSGNFPTMESGSVSGALGRYLGIAAGFEGIKIADSTLESTEYGVLKTFPGSGEVTQVDFTNFEEDPYIVASVRNASTSGVFFQRDPGSSIFVDVTSGLPPSEIIIVRIDDKV